MTGYWITNEKFFGLSPVNVFHREREPHEIKNDTERMNSHVLFRKTLTLDKVPDCCELSVTADDKYRLYINGTFVCEGPSPSYHFRYCYDRINVSRYLTHGKNVFAFHTYYQGLINRVWQSGDRRHGLLCELSCGGEILMKSDGSFLCREHSGFTETGRVGYDTQFLQRYDSNCAEDGFYRPDYDDSGWTNASVAVNDTHVLAKKPSVQLVYEKIRPVYTEKRGNTLFMDFGGCYVGYLCVKAVGKKGDTVTVRCGQELDGDGNVRYAVRANCRYEEEWILSGGTDSLDQIEYKSFRYAELTSDARYEDVYLLSRHYPFELKAKIRKEYENDKDAARVFDLCVRSQRYGVQETVLDCMEREKGVYLGDGCYTSLCNCILTKDDALMRKFIEDAFSSSFISDTLMSCLNCSYMQEIAEYPLILVQLLLWHYRLTSDTEYLRANIKRSEKLLSAYAVYEKDGILGDTGQWCVTEWPANYRDGYDVNNDGNKPLPEPHVAINAYYINAVSALNEMKKAAGDGIYRPAGPLLDSFERTFYDKEKHLFHDGAVSRHISYIGNAFAYGFGLCRDPEFYRTMTEWIEERGITGTSLFATFPLLTGLLRENRCDLIKAAVKDEKAWLNMLSEGATATFECWSRDGKWNTSLFHLQNTHIAVFISDADLSILPVSGDRYVF